VLTIEELREVWQATAEETDYNQIIRLLMFSLQRRGEIGSLDRSETDFGNNLITLPPKRTKNRHEHKIPMSDPIVAVLRKRRYIVGHHLFFGIGKHGYKDGRNPRRNLTIAFSPPGKQSSARKRSRCRGDCTTCDELAIL
jgi:integrase